MPLDNKGFRGYVSQLNIYNRALDFNSEIPDTLTSPRVAYSGTILRWNEFVYYKGVQPVYPSRASTDGCAVGTSCVKHGMILYIKKRKCGLIAKEMTLHKRPK